jgi:hypothetical protein
MKKPVMVSNRFKIGFMQQMDSLTNCFETETGLNAPNSLNGEVEKRLPYLNV